MNTKVKSGLIFLAGLASGAAGMFVFAKTKWQKSFDAKRDEMIRYYEVKYGTDNAEEAEPEPEKKDIHYGTGHATSEEVKEYEKTITKNNYAAISSPEKTKNDAPTLDDDYSDEPYEIDGHEYGSQEMYGMVTLFLHDDGEIVTDKYEPLDNESIENYIGTKNLEKLANLRDENPDLDAFYVRNDRLRIDVDIEIVGG